jgi:hypothetical protein
MNIAAIPTRYGDVMFRSRLEARYACWFDQCGVAWAYEPFDLDGYIPDFAIGGTALVEVKPALQVDDLEAAANKVWASGWMDGTAPYAVAVGASPNVAISVFRMAESNRPGRAFPTAATWVVPYCDPDLAEQVTDEMFRTGLHDGVLDEDWRSEELHRRWLEAGNLVQYKGAHARQR